MYIHLFVCACGGACMCVCVYVCVCLCVCVCACMCVGVWMDVCLISMKTGCDYLYGWIEKQSHTQKISAKMVNQRYSWECRRRSMPNRE